MVHCFLHFTQLFIHCTPVYHIIISEMYNNSLKQAIFFGLRLYLRYNRSRTSPTDNHLLRWISGIRKTARRNEASAYISLRIGERMERILHRSFHRVTLHRSNRYYLLPTHFYAVSPYMLRTFENTTLKTPDVSPRRGSALTSIESRRISSARGRRSEGEQGEQSGNWFAVRLRELTTGGSGESCLCAEQNLRAWAENRRTVNAHLARVPLPPPARPEARHHARNGRGAARMRAQRIITSSRSGARATRQHCS